jgi:hypothetical protein
MKTLFIQFFLLTFFASCGTDKMSAPPISFDMTSEGITSQLTSAQNEETIARIKIKRSSANIEWKSDYTKFLSEAFSNPNLFGLYKTPINTQDLRLVGCNNFNSLNAIQRKVFYIVYMAAIAEAESDFRAESKTFNPGDNTMNVGLLQIDEDVANNHTKGYLGNIDEEDLTDPKVNLQTGAFILKNQITGKIANGRLFPVRSYYWQVLTQKTRVLKNINLNRANIPFCQ